MDDPETCQKGDDLWYENEISTNNVQCTESCAYYTYISNGIKYCKETAPYYEYVNKTKYYLSTCDIQNGKKYGIDISID